MDVTLDIRFAYLVSFLSKVWFSCLLHLLFDLNTMALESYYM